MRLNCWILALACSLSSVCHAQTNTQVKTRLLPVRLNPTPAPPEILPPGLPPASATLAPSVAPSTQAAQPPAPGASPFVGRVSGSPAIAKPMVSPSPLPPNILAWDAESKDYDVKPGEMQAHFTFYFTNVSATNIIISSAVASCGCTVPKLPQLPWTNAPGALGEIPVTMQLAGKNGVVFKTITVNTDRGQKVLTVKAVIPPPQIAPVGPVDRNKNQELAKADRQAVFKGECASCHVEPAKGRLDKELYEKACGICHSAEHRATMVPDLQALNHDTNPDYWKTWVSQGKAGTLMPAFALSEGGPLNDAQINSLVRYLSGTIPAHPVKSAAAN